MHETCKWNASKISVRRSQFRIKRTAVFSFQAEIFPRVLSPCTFVLCLSSPSLKGGGNNNEVRLSQTEESKVDLGSATEISQECRSYLQNFYHFPSSFLCTDCYKCFIGTPLFLFFLFLLFFFQLRSTYSELFQHYTFSRLILSHFIFVLKDMLLSLFFFF